MGDTRLLRLTPSAALKEKRLADLLLHGDAADAERAVQNAQVVGSLELATATATGPAARDGLHRALRIRPGEPFAVAALIEWHAAITGGSDGLRTRPAERPQGPPPCPPEFIRARLEGLELWLGSESSTQLTAGQRGALVLARLVEILPFDEANGRVARRAAAHAMVIAGSRPPILEVGDRERLEACLQAAFQLQTEPLVALLEEASERALDLAIRALEG